jgi:hypothetical protein
MARTRILGVVLTLGLAVAACTGSSGTPGPSGGGGSGPSPSPSTVLLGPASIPPSNAPTPSAAPNTPTASSSPLACELISQADATTATGASMPAGKSDKQSAQPTIISRSDCVYDNHAAPSVTVSLIVATYVPIFPIETVEAGVLAKILASVGTKDGITIAASKLTIADHPGYTVVQTGTGAGNVPYQIETVAYWNGETTVAVMVGNAATGVAKSLATLVAGKLP